MGVSTPPRSLRRARVATALFFVVNGAALPSWAPRIPQVKEALGLSAGALGTALIAVSIGAVAGTMAAAPLARRFGTRAVMIAAAIAIGSALSLPGHVASGLQLGLVLGLLGALDGVLDTAMNAHGVEIERHAKRSVLQSLHAWWCVGAALGGGAGSLAAGLGVSVATHLGVTGLLLIVVGLAAGPSLLGPDEVVVVAAGPGMGSPRRAVKAAPLVAAAVVFGAVIEAVPFDWSAVFTRDVAGATPGVAGAAFAVFVTAMAATRGMADRLVTRFGSGPVVQVAVIGAVAGYVVALAAPVPAGALLGFAVVGAGAAPVFPALFARAGHLAGASPADGTALVSGVSRLGFLVAPPVVGWLAEGVGLRTAPLVGIVACAGVLLLWRRLEARTP